jgi:hypothetical protein
MSGERTERYLGVCYGTACAGLSSFFGGGASRVALRELNALLNGDEGNECQPPYPSCCMAATEMNPSM